MADKHFSMDMTIFEALQMHPDARHVFASFNLGGCALCHAAKVETLAQVCENYGIEPDDLLGKLEAVMAPSES